VARGGDIVLQRGSRIFTSVGLPKLAKKVIRLPQTHGT
jgi:hypothetical protein